MTIRRVNVVFLATLAVYAATRGIAYLPGQQPQELPGGIEVLSGIVPLVVWASLWLVAAALCLVGLFRGPGVHWAWITVAMGYTWGIAYLLAWMRSGFSTGSTVPEYLSAGTYLCPAVIFTLFILHVGRAMRPREAVQPNGEG